MWLTTRSYDPSLERFLQPDPSETDGLFSYVYVNDDPVGMKDPSGFAATPISCDSYCQTLIAVWNAWPTGMSPEQFEGYGGNPNGPIQPVTNEGGVWANTGPVLMQETQDASTVIGRSNSTCLIVDPRLEEVAAPNFNYAMYFHWYVVKGSVENFCPTAATNLQYRVQLTMSCPMNGALGRWGAGFSDQAVVTGKLDRNGLGSHQTVLGSLFESTGQGAVCPTEILNDDGVVIRTQLNNFCVNARVWITGQDANNPKILYSSAGTWTTTLEAIDDRSISWT